MAGGRLRVVYGALGGQHAEDIAPRAGWGSGGREGGRGGPQTLGPPLSALPLFN